MCLYGSGVWFKLECSGIASLASGGRVAESFLYTSCVLVVAVVIVVGWWIKRFFLL